MAASAGLILYWGRGQTFYADDWIYLVSYHHPTLQDWLYPQNGHLVVFTVLLFRGLLEVFGATSFLPFRLTSLALLLVCALLLHLLARRRVGPELALVPAILLLFLGSGWEIVMGVYGLNVLMGTAAGLGALLCLDRGETRGDVAACLLLAVSLASFSVGLVFAVIAAVEVSLRGGQPRPRRVWLYAIPLAAFAAWALWARQFHQSTLDLSNLGGVPSAVGDSAAAASASIFGLFRTPGSEVPGSPDVGIRIAWGIPIALALGAALLLRLRRGPPVSPRAAGLIVALLVYWVLIALSISEARAPNSSRYVLPAVVLVALLAVELARGTRVGPAAGLAVAAVLAISLVANVDEMRVAAGYFRDEGRYNRAELAALELTRGEVSPAFAPETPSSNLLPHSDMTFEAGAYFDAADEFGSPAYSTAELAAAPAAQREAADQLLGRALAIHAEPVRRIPPAGAGRVEPAGTARDAAAVPRGRCVLIRPDLGRMGRATLRLPPNGLAYATSPGAEVILELGRFGDGFAVGVAPVRGSAVVRIPADRSDRPWRALVSAEQPLAACPI